MDVYNDYLGIIEKSLGNTTTTNLQLYDYCKKIFGDRFKGVYSIDTICRLDHDECCIFNLDKSYESGSHWCGLYKLDDQYIVYDSFGRKSSILGFPFKKNVTTTEEDPEQEIHETNCGARTVSFLCCCYTIPIDQVLKI